jgi:putative FmdB family regulatory protein
MRIINLFGEMDDFSSRMVKEAESLLALREAYPPWAHGHDCISVLDEPPRPATEDSMPTYEYECGKCGHQFEFFQSMKDDPLTKCPEKGCRGKVQRLLSGGSGLIFKGSGFYITDYRSDSYKKAAKSDSSASSAASSPPPAPAPAAPSPSKPSSGGT